MEPHRQLFEAVRRILPQATIIVNKWTVLRLADRALLAVLRQTCAAENNAQRRQLMGCARLLRRGYAHLSEREAEALRMLLKQHSDLRVAYDLKRNFYGLWVCKSRAEAEARYACWERRVPPQLCTSFGQLIRFMGWWQQEVFSYFDHRLTNAFTEAMGAKLRTLQSVTPGQSFATLRAKFLYTTPVRRLTRARRSHKRGADA
jgi:transposase